MFKKFGLIVLLTILFMLSVLVIHTVLPENEWRFILIGMCAAMYLLIAQKLNKRLFTTKA